MGFLDGAVGVVNLLGHLVVANGEVDQAALRLRAPVLVSGHLHLTHAVELPALAVRVEADGNVPRGGGLLAWGMGVGHGHVL